MITVDGSISSHEGNAYIYLRDVSYSYVEAFANVLYCPTYLVRERNDIRLMQFVNQDIADEYIKKYGDVYKFVRINPV